jgi:3-oxo-5-alpha-steroid 4-dehydrogenase 1
VPRSRLFDYVSNPSYCSELVFSAGFARFTWSLAGVSIPTISMANLVFRTIATHTSYREKFADYPLERRILAPFIW